MPSFGDQIDALQRSANGNPNFCSAIDLETVRRALELTGTQSIRRRKLPAEQVVWLVIGMALFTDSSIENVANQLGLSLEGNISKSSVFEARQRLGAAPMAVLFALLCKAWTEHSRQGSFAEHNIYALDGTHIRVPDSDENFEAFGKYHSRRGEAGYPQIRMVAAIDTSSRLMHGANFGPLSTSEAALAEPILEAMPAGSICLMDRGFQGNERFWRITKDESGRNFVCRVKEDTIFVPIDTLEDGSIVGFIRTTGVARRNTPGLPENIPIRVIDYKIDDNPRVRLFTSLLNSEKYPAQSIAELYHERWEVELCFKEIKVDLFERREAIRSRKPEGVYQETWGALIMYNLIRRQMFIVASEQQVEASRLSFHVSTVLIYNFFAGHSSDPAVGRLPERLRGLCDEIWRLRLPPRRTRRRFPRAVKLPISSYPRKLPKPRKKAL